MESTFQQREERLNQGPRAKAASVQNGELRMEFSSGTVLSVPVRLLRPLAGLSEEQLQDVRVTVAGTILLWPRGGASIAVEALVEGATGVQTLKAAQRKGGQARSEAKTAAVRANGARGGRPRKLMPA